jgi:hypothetical protein
MSEHHVEFHIGTSIVVCTCGAYFHSEPIALGMTRDAVDLWAEHLRAPQDRP